MGLFKKKNWEPIMPRTGTGGFTEEDYRRVWRNQQKKEELHKQHLTQQEKESLERTRAEQRAKEAHERLKMKIEAEQARLDRYYAP